MISIVINADTRDERSNQEQMFKGVVDRDFLVEGVINKVMFFEGCDIEVVLFVDEHNRLSQELVYELLNITDALVVRKHTNEHSFNDYNYLSALHTARGDYIAHFDQDCAAFTNSSSTVYKFISLLETYSFVSYPSNWSPRAVHDESFGKRTWASTRFFMCKRETLKFDVLRNCIDEPEWAYAQFGDSPRRCNWLEHFLSLANNDSVFYPPINGDECAVFSWGSYKKGTLQELNNMPYPEVVNFINKHGGIVYPNDIFI